MGYVFIDIVLVGGPGNELIGIADVDFDAFHFFTDVCQNLFHSRTVANRHGIFDTGIGGGGKIQAQCFHYFNSVFFTEIKIQDNLNAHDQGNRDNNGRHDPVSQFFPDKVGQAILQKVFCGIGHFIGACFLSRKKA
jgi:hypothetical protein